MKYVRLILAVQDENVEKFERVLEEFLEGDELGHDERDLRLFLDTGIEGAYMSGYYDDRTQAVRGEWLDGV